MTLKPLWVALPVAAATLFAGLALRPADAQDTPSPPKAAAPATADAANQLVGKPAPAFTLPDQNDKPHSLKDNTGKWVVLAFYPADKTRG